MNRVLELRSKMGMTQDDFAALCGVARVSIARYEAGENIGRASAEKIAQACGVSVSFVLGYGDSVTNDTSPSFVAKPEPSRGGNLTDEDLAKIASIVNPNAEAPRTVEARIVSFGMDKLPAETRELILGMIRGMFANKPEAEYFMEKKGEAD